MPAGKREESLGPRQGDGELRLLENLVEQSKQPFVVLTRDGRFVRFNRSFERLTGYSAGELQRTHYPALAPERWQPIVNDKLAELFRSGNPLRFETETLRKDGTSVPIETIGNPFRNPAGEVEHVYAFVSDISERVLVKRRCAARTQQQSAVASLGRLALEGADLAALFDKAVDLIARTLDVDFCKILKLLPDRDRLLLTAGVGWKEGLVGTAVVDAGADSQAGFTLLSDTPINVDDLRTETRFKSPDLLVQHDIISGVSVVIGGRRGPLGVVGVHSTSQRAFDDGDARFVQSVANLLAAAIERQAVDEELRASQMLLSHVLGTAADAIISVDEESRITLFNLAAERIFGYETDEIVGQKLDLILPIDRATAHREHMRAFGHEAATARAMGSRQKVLGRRKDNSTFPAEVGISKTVVDGRMTFTAVARDITAREKLATQLRTSQRFDAVGQLAGGIAHDFNNLLTGITGFADLAREGIGPEHPASNDIAEVIKAAERAAALTRQLLAFSRQQVLQPVAMQVNSVVEELEPMLRRLLPEHLDVILELDPELGNVRMDPGQMEQVIVNLAVNARGAMPDGGILTIGTRTETLDSSFTREGAVVDAGAYCLLSVSDTGNGMTPETLRHIFEPFFTTKPQGEGTGMGLAMVYGIVKQSGGYIFLDSVLDEGTTVTILLPHTDDPVKLPAHPLPPERAIRGNETILLVEDNDAVAKVAERSLRNGGYRVFTASDPKEALRIHHEQGGAIDLLLTDVILPTMSGVELAERISADRPDLRVLFMSGYRKKSSRFRLDDANFLRKPFTLEALAREVRQALDLPR